MREGTKSIVLIAGNNGLKSRRKVILAECLCTVISHLVDPPNIQINPSQQQALCADTKWSEIIYKTNCKGKKSRNT